MLRKRHLVLFLVVACAALVLLALPESTRSRLRVAVGSLFQPLFGLTRAAHSGAERAARLVTPRSALISEIESLTRENERLRLALAEAEAAALENDRLRRMVGYAERTRWRLQPARVIGRSPANWWQIIHLDVGYRHGVTNNLPVLTPDGLVGRVVETSAWTSRVVLVGDPNCPVSASLVGTGESGIIRGASGNDLHHRLVELSYLPLSTRAQPGQRVVTSGQGGVYPRGIAVGEIVDTREVGDGIFLEARVRLAVEAGSLHEVWVKLP